MRSAQVLSGGGRWYSPAFRWVLFSPRTFPHPPETRSFGKIITTNTSRHYVSALRRHVLPPHDEFHGWYHTRTRGTYLIYRDEVWFTHGLRYKLVLLVWRIWSPVSFLRGEASHYSNSCWDGVVIQPFNLERERLEGGGLVLVKLVRKVFMMRT